jgi:hypothetical protein
MHWITSIMLALAITFVAGRFYWAVQTENHERYPTTRARM